MTVLRGVDGAWRISAMIDGYRVGRTYYGYTKREAMAMFRADTKAGAK